MNYNIIDKDHPFKREIIQLFNLFKEEGDQLFFGGKQDNTINITIDNQRIGNEIKAFATAETDKRTLSFDNIRAAGKTEDETRKRTKQALSSVWLKLLESITGKKHDWGILTGIRPVKLYHKLFQKYNSHDLVAGELKDKYLLKTNKISLLQGIVERQLKVIPENYLIDREVSLYIGIPFCPTKCVYCTFPAYGINNKHIKVDDFLSALHYEIEQIGKWLSETEIKVTAIYFGGGTPTSIEAEQLDRIFLKLSQLLNLKNVREITVEAGRPDTITPEKLEVLFKWGVGRISINPQTFSQKTLETIGRKHTVEEIFDKYQLAGKFNFNNINMDLIIGLPGESLENLIESLNQVEILQPDSLTIHTMAFKRASLLTKNRSVYEIANRREAEKMMEYSRDWTKKHNYFPYYLYRQKNMLGNLENIGYSKINKESLYNILIMEEKQTIIGLGSGAVSKLVPPGKEEVIRIANPKEPNAYFTSIKDNTRKKIEKLKVIFQK